MTSTMQLEFAQAMSDFKTMFPEMDKDVIEAVLRANQGAVEATIDQLLAMSTDNQNERLRNELDRPDCETMSTGTPNKSILNTSTLAGTKNKCDLLLCTPQLQSQPPQLLLSSTAVSGGGGKQTTAAINTGASPKVKKSIGSASASPSPGSPAIRNESVLSVKKWDPPLLGPLPASFLRINAEQSRIDFDIPDEQFALMLQNEEFMNELRWNQEFMMTLEKDQHEKGRGEDDAVFKERLKHMGKKSRKKFMQLAKVFTRQRNKKPGAVRHPDSLLLQEDHSDDDEPKKTKK